MASSGSDDNEWQPPTEAEMKILQARRERSDKISKLMGSYLLKGYKMLGTNCTACGCILMQDKQKKDYCIACSELDADTTKDDPAVNQEAARRQVAEEQQRQGRSRGESPEPTPTPMEESLDSINTGNITSSEMSTSQDNNANLANTPHVPPRPAGLGMPRAVSVGGAIPNAVTPPCVEASYPLRVLQAKMLQATRDLESSSSVESSIQLCQLIKACADTMGTLHKFNKDTPSPSSI